MFIHLRFPNRWLERLHRVRMYKSENECYQHAYPHIYLVTSLFTTVLKMDFILESEFQH